MNLSSYSYRAAILLRISIVRKMATLRGPSIRAWQDLSLRIEETALRQYKKLWVYWTSSRGPNTEFVNFLLLL